MAQDKQPFDVGREIAVILAEWRPQEGSAKDIADAIEYALSGYNIKVAPDLETELRSIFVYLRKMMDERLRSM